MNRMRKVLIADDEELELKAMHFFMERNYPEAMLLPDAQDGTQVVEIVTRENPELLILDIEMPGFKWASGSFYSQRTGI